MLKDLFNHLRLVNKIDNVHFSLTFGADQGICFIDLLDEVGPALLLLFRDEWRSYLDDIRLPANRLFSLRLLFLSIK